MRITTGLRASIVGLALVALGACYTGSTAIEQSWTARSARATQLRQVVTLFTARDGVLRRHMEDRMAQRLTDIGVLAIPAYRVLTDVDNITRERVMARLQLRGYDGVIVMRVLAQPSTPAPENFDSFTEVSQPQNAGEMGSISTVIRMEANVYSLRDNQLVWSGLTRTVDPTDLSELVEDVTRVVTFELERRAVVEEF